MHRQILGLEHGDTRKGDHRDGDTLNNQRRNLRIATVAQNSQNKKKQRSKSGMKGVWFDRARGTWRASLETKGKTVYLGHHRTAALAHQAYCDGAQRVFGEFARFA